MAASSGPISGETHGRGRALKRYSVNSRPLISTRTLFVRSVIWTPSDFTEALFSTAMAVETWATRLSAMLKQPSRLRFIQLLCDPCVAGQSNFIEMQSGARLTRLASRQTWLHCGYESHFQAG